MEISPRQLVAACAALFGGIVALNLFAQYRDNAEVKDRLSSLNLNDLVPRLKREEGLPDVEPPEINEATLVDRLIEAEQPEA